MDAQEMNLEKVTVFLGWSKPTSRKLAEVLKKWLSIMLWHVEPVFSDDDIYPGAFWRDRLNGHLAKADYGIFCITRENCASEWMHFEAGVLWGAKFIQTGAEYICPFLFNMDIESMKPPFRDYQYVSFQKNNNRENKKSVYRLIEVLNDACGKKNPAYKLDDTRLKASFDALYPRLARKLNHLEVKNDSRKSDFEDDREQEGRGQDDRGQQNDRGEICSLDTLVQSQIAYFSFCLHLLENLKVASDSTALHEIRIAIIQKGEELKKILYDSLGKFYSVKPYKEKQQETEEFLNLLDQFRRDMKSRFASLHLSEKDWQIKIEIENFEVSLRTCLLMLDASVRSIWLYFNKNQANRLDR